MDYLTTLLQVYHGINRFMATDSGELFKKFVELFLFFTVTYMIASEYGRSRERQLKWLLFGFFALVINKAIMSLTYALVVFGDVRYLHFNPILPLLDLFLEIVALILLTNSFLFPAFRDRTDLLTKKIGRELSIITVVMIITEAFWLIRITNEPTAAFREELSFLVLELIKILVLYGLIFVILCNYSKFRKYGPNIMLAFAVYMITPLINVINAVFYSGLNNDLRVLAHPFPFISILLLTRVTYLKLVDKAHLKRELDKAKEKYVEEHELNKMKDEFVSTVSHELKTPITSMKLYLSLLLSNKFGKLAKKQRNAIEIVSKEAQRLQNLISDVLSLAKLENKKSALCMERIDLNKLVRDNLYQTLAEDRGIAVHNEVPKNFMVAVDPEKFKQVFINLFSNAINYGNSNIWVRARMHKKTWSFYVQDDGPGIPEDKQAKLFEKFYRVGNYLTKEQGGTGLGLAIVKNIVELHGGKVRVESKENKGTTFVVELPFS